MISVLCECGVRLLRFIGKLNLQQGTNSCIFGHVVNFDRKHNPDSRDFLWCLGLGFGVYISFGCLQLSMCFGFKVWEPRICGLLVGFRIEGLGICT